MDVDHLVECMIRLSYLVTDHPEIAELDINPLLVTPAHVVALDARVVPDGRPDVPSPHRYAHLALRPYPEEYVQELTLAGTRLTLRPIRPEDEPLWFDLLASCSQESLYTRFRTVIHWKTHQVALRYCFIDYEREMAIVAEAVEEGKRRLLGVGRMIAEAEQETVEYAILVTDGWQNKGLGSTLTTACLEIAKSWGRKRVVAYTNTDNPRMVAVFRKLGFRIEPGDDGTSVTAVREL
jgi:acetyltransferase